jgi:predicted HTH transcriptional regulator
LQWDVINHEKNKGLRKSALKTIAAFLNSEGGTLVIGVEDDKSIFGIDRDLALTENSEDKFLNLLSTLISDCIGAEYAGLIKTRIEPIDGKSVCILDIDKSLLPAYLIIDGQKEFYVRMNNTSRSLDPEETVKYISQNWA